MEPYIWIDGKQLMSYNRLDLMAKYIFVESVVTGYGIDWAYDLYSKHIEAFSGGGFREPGNDEKNSLEKYIDIFNKLILDISSNGMNPEISLVPVSRNNHILDGAHRVAIAAYFNLKVPCCVKNEEDKYDYCFFSKMHLDQKYIDAMVTKYVEVCGKKCYVIYIWPKGYKNQSVLEEADSLIELRTNGRVVCKKDVDMNYKGLKNLMIQAYNQHDWIGSISDHFKGVEGKVTPCYDACEKMRAYIVELDEAQEIVELKKEIRELFAIENHSVHSSDNYEETVLLTHLLFNENSLNLLNYGEIDYDSAFIEKVYEFKSDISKKRYDISKFIIDSSGILGLYGIRKVGDLDYLTIEHEVNFESNKYDDNSNYSSLYGCNEGELILNPLFHCYAYGIKFISLGMLKVFKLNRAQKKDLEDAKLIDSKLRQSMSVKLLIQCLTIKLKRNCRNIKTGIRHYLEDNNIYFFTKAWHFIIRKGFK